MKTIKVLLGFLFTLSASSMFAQTYSQNSGNVCSAYTDREYVFTDTPEAPVAGTLSIEWLYCGPWGNSNSGSLSLDIWVDGGWQDLLNTSDSGNGCTWVPAEITMSADLINDAINSNGGSILMKGRISDSCPGGVGCSFYSDPCFNLTLVYDFAPDADFLASNTSTCVNGPVTFQNQTSGPQETFDWNFGPDAIPSTATGPGPHEVFWTSQGIKDVSLTVNGNGDESVETKAGYVDVGPAPASVVFGEAYESWQVSAYDEGISSKRIVRNNIDGYYVIGELNGTDNQIWVKRIAENGSEVWNTLVESNNNDSFQDAVVDEAGNLFITGQRNSNILLAKISPDGATEWSTDYNFSGNDEGTAIDIDASGNIYVAGSKSDLVQATAVKFDSNGNYVFDVTVAGIGSNVGTDIIVENDAFYLLSWGRTTGINPDMHLSKYELVLGINDWTVDYNGNGFSTDEAHEMESFGDFIYIMGESDQGAENGWTVVQISKDGVEGWSEDFFAGESDSDASDRFGMDADGNLFLASTVSASPDDEVSVLKINGSNGNQEWAHTLSGINDTQLEALEIADNGNIFVLARTQNNSGDWDLATFEMDQNASDLWWAVYNGCGSEDDFTGGIIATPNHEVIATGYNAQAMEIRYGALIEPDASFGVVSGVACAGSAVTFEDQSTGSGLTYSWDFGDDATPSSAMGAGPHDVVFASAGMKDVTLTISNGLGSSEFDSAIDVSNAPELTLSENTTSCAGDELELSASGTGDLEWADGLGSTSLITVSPTESTTYTVVLTSAEGCSSEGSIDVTVYEYPAVNAGDDITACEGTTVTLNGSGEGSLAWNNDAGDGANPEVLATGTTTYTITATNEGGCASTDNMELTVNEAPDVSAGMDVTICDGESIELTASGADNYTWALDNSTETTLMVSPTETTTYVVTGVDENNCSEDAQVTVTVAALPQANAGEDVSICSGEDVTLTATGGTNYDWNELGAGASQTVSPEENATYLVTVTNEDGCLDSDEVMVTVNETPTADAGEDQTICIGTELTLTGSGGVTYEWEDLGEGQSQTVSPESSNTYTLLVEAANGCTDEDEVFIQVLPLPIINAGSDMAICIGESAGLNATGGETYEWNNGLGEGQSHQVEPLTTTTYVVTAIDQFGCENVDEVTITVNLLPSINAGADQLICPGETTTLNASGAETYEWDNGAGDGSSVEVNPTETTTYVVTGTNENGCEGTDEITVEVYPLVELSISGLGDENYCIESDETITLDGTPTGGDFSGPGVANNEFTPANAGIGEHTIIYTFEDENGCEFESTETVIVEVCNSIGELMQIEMELYPNPNTGRFSLYWNADVTPEVTNISVHDIQGRAVAFETTRLGDRLEIQLSQPVAGTYTVSLLLNNTPWNKTFVLTK